MLLVLKKGEKVVVIDTKRLDESNLTPVNKTNIMGGFEVIGILDEENIYPESKPLRD